MKFKRLVWSKLSLEVAQFPSPACQVLDHLTKIVFNLLCPLLVKLHNRLGNQLCNFIDHMLKAFHVNLTGFVNLFFSHCFLLILLDKNGQQITENVSHANLIITLGKEFIHDILCNVVTISNPPVHLVRKIRLDRTVHVIGARGIPPIKGSGTKIMKEACHLVLGKNIFNRMRTLFELLDIHNFNWLIYDFIIIQIESNVNTKLKDFPYSQQISWTVMSVSKAPDQL